MGLTVDAIFLGEIERVRGKLRERRREKNKQVRGVTYPLVGRAAIASDYRAGLRFLSNGGAH